MFLTQILKKINSCIRNVLTITCISLVLILCIDLVGSYAIQFIVKLKNYSKASIDPESKIHEGFEWSGGLKEELIKRKTETIPYQYAPYIAWENTSFDGDYLNINNNGQRKTCYNSDAVDAKKVFVFGGSTLFNARSPDCLTITSIMSKLLNRSGNYVVNNIGAGARHSTIELIKLILLLQSGTIPDIVVFYDGVNEINTLFLEGKVGVHVGYNLISKKINGKILTHQETYLDILITIVEDWYKKSFYKTIVNIVQSKLLKSTNNITITKVNNNKQQVIQTAKIYLKNLEIAHALSKYYGFKLFAFLQPTLYVSNNKTLSKEERDLFEKKMNDSYQKAYQLFYDYVRQKANLFDFFYDVSNAFDEQEKTIYADFAHVGPKGHEIIANKFYEILSKAE